ncbi:MAG: aminoacyl-tRNA hydrolase [Clostridia bacterium]|nr:aminoacyl-tRNA hydrolase [Clostridia bacterium]
MFRKKLAPLMGGITHIVVGLGNPDRKYENTRHNAGFMAIDALAEKYDVCIDRLKYKSYCASVEINQKKVLLMKPQTYMNNSGQAVVEAMNFYKVPAENVVVLLDDISLDVGQMRIRRKGSDGGQKGMRSIIYLTGKDTFPRVKIGVGHKPEQWELADWVLSNFGGDERKKIEEVTSKAASAAELIICGEIDKAMNLYN